MKKQIISNFGYLLAFEAREIEGCASIPSLKFLAGELSGFHDKVMNWGIQRPALAKSCLFTPANYQQEDALNSLRATSDVCLSDALHV
jgi:hypothetical protein